MTTITSSSSKRLNKILLLIASKVQSADKTNREAHAATIYWRILFEDFRRNNVDDIRNSALELVDLICCHYCYNPWLVSKPHNQQMV
jgi:CRISPR/Cas system-associated endonuclease Cas1